MINIIANGLGLGRVSNQIFTVSFLLISGVSQAQMAGGTPSDATSTPPRMRGQAGIAASEQPQSTGVGGGVVMHQIEMPAAVGVSKRVSSESEMSRKRSSASGQRQSMRCKPGSSLDSNGVCR